MSADRLRHGWPRHQVGLNRLNDPLNLTPSAPRSAHPRRAIEGKVMPSSIDLAAGPVREQHAAAHPPAVAVDARLPTHHPKSMGLEEVPVGRQAENPEMAAHGVGRPVL